MKMATLLNVERSGRKAGRTLLLIHPLGSDLRFWDECRAYWNGDFQSIAVDLRPMGQSPNPKRPVGINEHIADLVATLDKAEAQKVVAIGCALGGMVAAPLASKHAHRVEALIMANPGISNTPAVRTILAERAKFVRENGTAALLPATAIRTFHNLQRDARFDCYLQDFAEMDAGRYTLAIEGFLDVDISADLPCVKCPALLVPGVHDIIMDPRSVDIAASLLPDSKTVRMEDAAHFVPYQAAAPFAKCVSDFITGLPAA
jgi:3-oxoadipate enol-lactonase